MRGASGLIEGRLSSGVHLSASPENDSVPQRRLLTRSRTASQPLPRQARPQGQLSLGAVVRCVGSTRQLRSEEPDGYDGELCLWEYDGGRDPSSASLEIFRLCMLIMDWMQQSLAPPPGGVWSVVPQLTTALGYGLLACETCVLNFDPVSMPSRPSAGRDLVPVRTWFLSEPGLGPVSPAEQELSWLMSGEGCCVAQDRSLSVLDLFMGLIITY